jgi:hypothetical protein
MEVITNNLNIVKNNNLVHITRNETYEKVEYFKPHICNTKSNRKLHAIMYNHTNIYEHKQIYFVKKRTQYYASVMDADSLRSLDSPSDIFVK